MTNEEFLSHQLNYSKFGMLSTAVLFECIQKGVDSILKDKEEHLKQAEENEAAGKRSIVHVPSFIGAVDELNDRLKEKYEPVVYKYDDEGNKI